MIKGNLEVRAFGYGIGDGRQQDGKTVKVLAMRDAHTQMQIAYVFTTEEFDKFIETITGNHIVPAHSLPNDIKLVQ
jgi:hypothetical protein